MTPTARAARIVNTALPLALVAVGLMLLAERAREEGLPRVWSVALLLLGVAQLGLGSQDDIDQAWWLIATGCKLFLDTLNGALVEGSASLLLIASGAAGLRQAIGAAASSAPTGHSL